MNKKKILITGGLGFIGTHCILKWYNENWDVWVLDNLSTNAINVDHPVAKLATVLVKDIIHTDWNDLPKFDLILHLASPVGPVGVLKHSGKMARIILDDIYSVIEGSNHSNCPVVFVSTSEIYGYRLEKSYLKEEDDKVLHGEYSVRNEYAVSKLLSEIVLTNHAKINTNFKYQIIRPFNVTGEYQLPDGGFVLPRFVNQALTEQDITVYYDGLQIRAFTWVKDIVDGIYLASIAKTELWNQEWNIGNEQNENTIKYLAERVKNITNSNSNITHVDPKTLHGPLFTEAPEKIPNSEKIKTLLNWKPVKSTDEVIDEVINFYKHE
jgi:nucleoside-diphosphate-sugar epimerase